MDATAERTALAAAVVCAAAAGITLAGGPPGHASRPDAAAGVLQAWAALVALVVALREWLAGAESAEAEEAEALRRRAGTGLFATDAAPLPFSAARSRAILERRIVPLVAPLFGTVLLLASRRLWQKLPPPHEIGAPATAVTDRLAWFGAATFVLLILARYLIVASRAPSRVRLRAAGVAAAAAAGGAGAALASALALRAGLPGAPRMISAMLAAGLAVLGLEQWVFAILELYRPRRPEDPPSSPYESRLVRRLCDPTAWLRTAAESLDYQFGFAVSRTWVAAFLARTVAPLAVLQAAVLWGLTCLVALGPEEQGLRERWGRPVGGRNGTTLGPGLHAKWPWPIEIVRRAPTRRPQRLFLGFDPHGPEPADLLWSRPHHAREDRFLAAVTARGPEVSAASGAAPASIVNVNLPVEYAITNLYDYLYSAADPAALIGQIARRVLTTEIAGRDVFDILGPGQAGFADALSRRLGEEVGRLRLGVAITFVGVQGVHPPVEVAEAFESVVEAIEERETAILSGRAHAARVVATSEASARRIVQLAEAARDRIRTVSAAAADRFRSQKAAHDAGTRVYPGFVALETLRRALAGPRLYVVAATPEREVLHLNLEPKLSSVLWDLDDLTTNRPGPAAAGAGRGEGSR